MNQLDLFSVPAIAPAPQVLGLRATRATGYSRNVRTCPRCGASQPAVTQDPYSWYHFCLENA